jgi:hypothetical protein
MGVSGNRIGAGPRSQPQTIVLRRADPASQAIMDELASIGLVDADDKL